MCIPPPPSGLFLPVSCPDCSGDVVLVTGTRDASFQAGAVVHCADCRRDFFIRCSLMSVPKPDAETNRNHMRKVRANA